MNFNIDLKKFDLAKAIKVLTRILPILSLLLAGGAIGFGLYRLNQVITVIPDPEMVKLEQETVEKAQIKFDIKTIDSLNHLTPVEGKVDLTNLGKTDPFSP